MLRPFKSLLQRKLIAAFALVIAVPLAIISIYAIARSSELLFDSARLEHMHAVGERAVSAERQMLSYGSDLQALALAPAVRRSLNVATPAQQAGALRDAESELVAFLKRAGNRYTHVCLIDAQGRELACATNDGGAARAVAPAVAQAVAPSDRTDGAPQSDLAAALAAGADGQPRYLNSLHWPGVGTAGSTAGGAADMPTLRYAGGLRNDAGAIAGALVLDAPLAPILELLAAPPGPITTYVVDAEGNYLLHPDPQRRFGRWRGTPYRLQTDRPRDAAALLSQQQGALLAAADRPDALQAFARINSYDARALPWIVIDEVPMEAVLGDVRQTRVVITVLAALALLLAIGAAMLLTHSIVRPVSTLAAAAEAISQDRLDTPLPSADGDDEISVLTRAFARMTTRMRKLVGDLERRVTELEHTEARLREGESRLRQMIEANLVGILFVDLDGHILDANDAFLRMLGYSREELRRGSILRDTITPPEYRDITARAIAETRRRGACTPYEKEYARKDGSRVPVLVGLALIEGSTDQAVAFVLDQTERKQAEADRQARYAAEVANRAKSEFLAKMSHELRTPLNAVLGYAQIMQWERGLSERQRAGLSSIQKSGEQLLRLIVDLLDLSSLETGRFRIEPVEVELAGFIEGVGEIIRAKAQQRDVTYVCDAVPPLPRVVLADGVRLRQVLINLLDNAIKFSDQGEVRLRISAVAGAGGTTQLRFEVADSGVGIAPGDLERVFLPFEQIGDGQRRGSGTGLGLAIGRHIVRLMGGDMHVESEPGRGSRFWFELQTPVLQQAAETPAPARSLPVRYEGPRRKVLIADDVAVNRKMLVDVLTTRGFDVLEAQDGEEAVRHAVIERPDIVLMDVAMPVLNGLDATRRLRQSELTHDIAVICVSAGASEGDRASSLAAGANDFIVKPVDLSQLLMRIGALLGLKWVDED